MSEAPVAPGRELLPEDEARADFYALLGRLFADAPDARLLATIADAPPLTPAASTVGGPDVATALSRAWEDLRAASAAADLESVREEFQALFVGVGRSEVSLYASHYVGPQSGRPLAEIRATLAEFGLARRAAKQRIRRPSRRAVRDDAHAGRRRRRTASRGAVATARVLQSAPDDVGIRLLHCNRAISCCQLLPSRCTIL